MGTTWTHDGHDLDALAARLADRLPRSERSLRAAGLGTEDLLSEARLAVAELVRTYDPAKGTLDAWVMGGAWRVGVNLARRSVGRVAPEDALVQRALRTVRAAEPTGAPHEAERDVERQVAERTGLPEQQVRRSLAALRDRTALGGVADLDPADDACATRQDAVDAAERNRRLWHVVEAASELDAEHARRRATEDDDDVDPLRAVLPGTLGMLVLAAQAGGQSLLDVARLTGVPVASLAAASSDLACRARRVAACHARLVAA